MIFVLKVLGVLFGVVVVGCALFFVAYQFAKGMSR